MQFFELCILLTLFTSIISLLVKPERRPKILFFLPPLALFFILLHLFFEGFRWQMIPTYLLTGIFLVPSYRYLQHKGEVKSINDRKWLRVVGMVFSILLLVFTAITGSILPVFDLPEPRGPYIVGTSSFMLEDSTRMEMITEDPDDQRRVVVRTWYPADHVNSENPQMEYMHPFEAEYFAMKYGLPAFTLNHLEHIGTYAYKGATVSESESSFPVLLFSHGYNVAPSTYASFLTDIASHGYIIFAINHPYQSVATVFPDGNKVSFDYEYESKNFEYVWQQIMEREERFWAANTDSVKRDIIREISKLYPNADMIRYWALDLSFVIDEMEKINLQPENQFYQKLNLNKIGVFGHSAGGAAAGQLMLSDTRLKAGINWDGAQWADMIDSALTEPFLRIEAVRDSTTFAPNDLIFHNRSESDLVDIKIDGIGHSSFSDIPFLIPVQSINEAGSADPNDATSLISDLSISFFDKYLKNNERIELSDFADKFQHVSVRVNEYE